MIFSADTYDYLKYCHLWPIGMGYNQVKMRKTSYFSVWKVKLRAKGHTYFAWKVDGRINGIRHRRFFSNREEAARPRSDQYCRYARQCGSLTCRITHE